MEEFVSLVRGRTGELYERTSNLLRDEKGNPVAIHGVFRIYGEEESEMEIIELRRDIVLFDSLKEGVYQSGPTEDGIFTSDQPKG